MSLSSQRSFAHGEVSPKLYGRADLAAYQRGLRTARNVTVTKEGGVRSRAGTLYVGSSKSDGAARYVECVFATGQEYLLEFGVNYLRFWLADALVTVGTPSAWLTATAYAAGTSVENDGTNYLCILAHTSGDTDDEPGVGATTATYWYPLTSNVLEVPTPYTTMAIVRALSFADENATTRLVAHPSFPMRALVRLSASAWTFAAATFSAADPVDAPTNLVVTGAAGNDATFTRYQVTAVAGTLESAVSNIDGWNKRPGPASVGNQTPITLAWDAVSGATAYNIYTSWSGNGFRFKVQVTTNSYVDEITSQYIHGSANAPPGEDRAVTDLTAAGYYPGTLGVYQGRLIVAGQTAQPDAIIASAAGNFRDFYPHFPIVDDDAIAWKHAGGRLNRIRHVTEAGGRLAVFSEIGEGVTMGEGDGPLRPGEVYPRMVSWWGATTLPPLLIGDTLLYVQARGGLVRAFRPGDGWGADLTVTAGHLVEGYTLTDHAYQQTPDPIAWFVRSDGVLLSLTFSPETGVVAWARHDTDGTVESVACLPVGTEDRVYLLVNRPVTGAAAWTIDDPWPTADASHFPSMAYAPSLGVAVAFHGISALAKFMRTADGEVWTTHDTDGDTNDVWYSGIWVSWLNLFVAVNGALDAGLRDYVVTSPTGVTWTARFPQTGSAGFDCVVDTGTRVVALGSAEVSVSTDAVTWPAPSATTGPYSRALKGAYDSTNARIVVVDSSPGGTLHSAASPFTTWTAVTVPAALDGEALDVKWAGDRIVALTDEAVFYTTDLENWTEVALPAGALVMGVFALDYNAESDLLFALPGAVSADRGETWTALSEWVASEDESFGSGVYLEAASRVVTVSGFATANIGASWVPYPAELRYLERMADRTEDWPGLVCADAAVSGATTAGVVDGLDHLEGMAVSVVADGVVLASPNNPAYAAVTVSGGEIDLGEDYDEVIVGLPFTVDVRTLDLESAGGRSVKTGGFNVTRLGLWLEETMGLWAGPKPADATTSLTGLSSLREQDDEGVASEGVAQSGYRELGVPSMWTRGGSIHLRHVDPTPVTINAIIPMGEQGRT